MVSCDICASIVCGGPCAEITFVMSQRGLGGKCVCVARCKRGVPLVSGMIGGIM